jgi:hypothetical protein
MPYAGNTGGSGSTASEEEGLTYWEKEIPSIGPVKRRQQSGILSAQDSGRLSRQKVALVAAG